MLTEEAGGSTDLHVAHSSPDGQAGAALLPEAGAGLFGNAAVARLTAGTPFGPRAPAVILPAQVTRLEKAAQTQDGVHSSLEFGAV